MVRVVHFSDWHGSTFELPPADIYVCTGDMLPNFPVVFFDNQDDGDIVEWRPNDHVVNGGLQEPKPLPTSYNMNSWRKIDHEHERVMQELWIKRQGSYRQFFGNPGAPVVCVRGNHCFIDLAPMFSGGEVWEVDHLSHKTARYCGLTFGGVRGINYICGEWSDELGGVEWNDAVKEIPLTIDVLVSHAPPRGILDSLPFGNTHLGSDALSSYVNRRMMQGDPLRAHLFGHIHECCVTETIGGTLFSNAATTFHDLEV